MAEVHQEVFGDFGDMCGFTPSDDLDARRNRPEGTLARLVSSLRGVRAASQELPQVDASAESLHPILRMVGNLERVIGIAKWV